MMEENNAQPSLINFSLTNGALLGVVMVIAFLLLYVIDAEYFISWWSNLLGFGIVVGMSISMGIKYRKACGNVLNYGQSFLVVLLISAIGSSLIYSIFEFLMYTVIDPDLPQMVEDNSMEMMDKFASNMPEADYNRTMQEMDKISESFTLGRFMLNGLLVKSLLWGIVALLTCLFVKKNETFS